MTSPSGVGRQTVPDIEFGHVVAAAFGMHADQRREGDASPNC
jgi:hypothetical protein